MFPGGASIDQLVLHMWRRRLAKTISHLPNGIVYPTSVSCLGQIMILTMFYCRLHVVLYMRVLPSQWEWSVTDTSCVHLNFPMSISGPLSPCL